MELINYEVISFKYYKLVFVFLL